MSKFRIGDKVLYVHVESVEKWIDCPECFGKRFLTVILGDDSRVTIDCVGCGRGYEPPRGLISTNIYMPVISERQIEGVNSEMKEGKEVSTYKFYGGWSVEETALFTSRIEAELYGSLLANKLGDEALEKIHRKEKDTRTWSWNAHYHRDCIRRAKKDIGYHEAKLNAALPNVKTEVKP